jgi:hypothetical protein
MRSPARSGDRQRFDYFIWTALPSLPESKRDKALSQSQSMKALVTAQARAEATETEKRAKTRWRDYLLNKQLYVTGGRISEVLGFAGATSTRPTQKNRSRRRSCGR